MVVSSSEEAFIITMRDFPIRRSWITNGRLLQPSQAEWHCLGPWKTTQRFTLRERSAQSIPSHSIRWIKAVPILWHACERPTLASPISGATAPGTIAPPCGTAECALTSSSDDKHKGLRQDLTYRSNLDIEILATTVTRNERESQAIWPGLPKPMDRPSMPPRAGQESLES